ncbi:GFA family protein [Sphingobium sp. Sx8-8]|uniref:GFA family protein n=1 Tax=Sphingobium sp. Sx8-8 TaxID=2933617 RepID=UPI001F578B08|nr:GFA family protein [Sphingobium sp. Sx8-8]
MVMKGGCLCGAIRYEIADDATPSAVCHCRNCQKQSGASFSINLLVSTADFTMSGTPRRFIDTSDRGTEVHREFCGQCGSPLVSRSPARLDRIAVKAGTLDDPSGLKPSIQVWCDSAQPWLSLPDLPSVARQPTPADTSLASPTGDR